jgi:DNA processing protein
MDADTTAVPALDGTGTVNTDVSDDERAARAELGWLAEPGDRLLGALVRTHGAAPAMKLVRAGRLPDGTALAEPHEAQRALSRWQAALAKVPPRREVRRALEGPFRLVCPGDAEWPAGLDALGDAAPFALWVTGQADLALSCQRSVAVTGSRAATAYGSYLAADIASGLGARGWTVICGGSFGIDASAHRGALAADASTVAVTAGGIDVPYPAAHADLLAAIARQGVLVSEAPPGTLPGRLRFHARNRVIAALANGTVIIEAGTRSGAMTVAKHALGLRRPVMAIPGPVTSELSAGCHDLIRSSLAVLVTGASDVIDTLTAAGATVHPAS